MQTFRGHNHRVQGVAFSPDGRLVASLAWIGPSSSGKSTPARNIGSSPGRTRRSSRPVSARTIAPHRRCSNGTIRIWDVKSGKLLHRRSTNLDRPRSIAFGSDGQLLAAAGRHGTIPCWDLAKDQAISESWQHGEPRARAVAFSPDGRRLASTGDDGTVKLWKPPLEDCLPHRAHRPDSCRGVSPRQQDPCLRGLGRGSALGCRDRQGIAWCRTPHRQWWRCFWSRRAFGRGRRMGGRITLGPRGSPTPRHFDRARAGHGLRRWRSRPTARGWLRPAET